MGGHKYRQQSLRIGDCTGLHLLKEPTELSLEFCVRWFLQFNVFGVGRKVYLIGRGVGLVRGSMFFPTNGLRWPPLRRPKRRSRLTSKVFPDLGRGAALKTSPTVSINVGKINPKRRG